MTTPEAAWLTLSELAAYLKCSRETIYKYAQEGVLPGVKLGRRWRFRLDLVNKWLIEERSLSKFSTNSIPTEQL